jgi:hypothetical protein
MSMATAMSAAGLRNPNAIRVVALILVLTDSIRPLLRPVIKGGVYGVEVLADFAAELGDVGNAAPGGPFQPAVEGTFAVPALELERQPQP